jgi:hypothetical protein
MMLADADLKDGFCSTSLEILQTAQEEGCWPGPRCRKVISKVELSEVIAFNLRVVCALAHKAETRAPKASVPIIHVDEAAKALDLTDSR